MSILYECLHVCVCVESMGMAHNVQVVSQQQQQQQQQQEQEQDQAEMWQGPLAPFTTFNSVKEPMQCVVLVRDSLQELETRKLVDWELSGFSVCSIVCLFCLW